MGRGLAEFDFVRASEADLPSVRALLTAAQLPADAMTRAEVFTLARRGMEFAGCGGVEVYAESALLRSLAVDEGARGMGLGRRLIERAVVRAHRSGARRIFLLTETADRYFAKFGFLPCRRDEVPRAVIESPAVAGHCRVSAQCMVRDLSHAAVYFPRDALPLANDASGARYFAAGLDAAQITYYEVPPDAFFEPHEHAGEQVTLVLSGELVFDAGALPVRVGAGEVIALPPAVRHAVRAGPRGATAVDAWSPPTVPYSAETP